MKRAVLAVVVAACGGKAKPAEPPAEPAPAVITGVAECDEYIAKMYSSSQCEHATPEQRERALMLVHAMVEHPQQFDVSGMGGACAESLAQLDESVRAQGCEVSIPTGDYVAAIRAWQPPPEHPEATMEHCGWYARAVDDYARCDKVPAADGDAAKADLAAMQATFGEFEAMPEDERLAKDDVCLQAYGATIDRWRAAGCE